MRHTSGLDEVEDGEEEVLRGPSLFCPEIQENRSGLTTKQVLVMASWLRLARTLATSRRAPEFPSGSSLAVGRVEGAVRVTGENGGVLGKTSVAISECLNGSCSEQTALFPLGMFEDKLERTISALAS